MIFKIGEVTGGIPELEQRRIIDLVMITDGVLREIGELLLIEPIVAGVEIDAHACQAIVDQRLRGSGFCLPLCIGNQLSDVEGLRGGRGTAGGEIGLECDGVDLLELVGLDVAHVAILGEDI
ncbi:hypothetical protein SDC9_180365 [bioreactor metagenome]|uniref:Uncharacterized protein n=1 Tax=bioreactor metagenome TaxID=1076179 RepID=A0A645H3I3_9ZZZZ